MRRRARSWARAGSNEATSRGTLAVSSLGSWTNPARPRRGPLVGPAETEAALVARDHGRADEGLERALDLAGQASGSTFTP